MQLIIFSSGRCKSRKVTLGPIGLLSICFVLVMCGIAMFNLGVDYAVQSSKETLTRLYEQAEVLHLKELEQQRLIVNQAKNEAENNLDALASRLSKLQGHILRLDALGARLAKMANLDDIEFSALEPLGMGGPIPTSLQNSIKVSDFVAGLELLSQKLEDRSDKLTAIESMLIDRALQAQTLPEGRPVTSGWVSSLFGWRPNPISGKREFHEGIDFAGKPGSQVSAVAAGIVTWSGKRYGFGNMVEINHGNGYVTRYAHNKKNLVAVGDKVNKGQIIAVMGSSGRSTGTHVHFEVVHIGKQVNPKKYISVN